jgi:hypothetical protein
MFQTNCTVLNASTNARRGVRETTGQAGRSATGKAPERLFLGLSAATLMEASVQ